MMYASIHTSQTYAILTALGTLRPACHLIHSKVKETIPIHSISIKAAQSLCKYCHLIHSKSQRNCRPIHSNSIKAPQSLRRYCHLIHSKVKRLKETVALSIQINQNTVSESMQILSSDSFKSQRNCRPIHSNSVKTPQSLSRYCHLIHSEHTSGSNCHSTRLLFLSWAKVD